MRYEKNTDEKTNGDDQGAYSTRQIILDAATQLFLEKNYKAVTLREIATEAGVTLGLIPYYFSSKENLAISVGQNLVDQLYRKASDYDVSCFGSGEKLYIYTLLSWIDMEEDERYTRFYSGLIEAAHASTRPSSSFIAMTWDVIREYRLSISQQQNDVFLAVLKGAERELMMQRYRKSILVTREEILDMTLSNYFYNIGLSDETIASIITKSQRHVRQLRPDIKEERTILLNTYK